ncbi:thiamine pyrophosphate-binding protein [Halorubrum sp. JWXQ-INN 858]|uniref:thiamine pyrophosphate-binding protein n=1 Tax=Halorubrum sp. JWXQ-INN 858 TaxID=2690782 RepID=UPI001358A0C1|nr:thiamine pyrophosphate-dependent enzyme [Halorubrum sp. JWXQ-INN 858]MWV64851.1 thiamine pyrophosphate-binding protein [Halorubrum sp. JWXQ-INN 858]
MYDTGAEYLIGALEEYGVTHLFGNPGTTELPIVQATDDSPIEYVLGLHEDVAVGMAAGYASTRRYHSHHDDDVTPLGVANLHVAPGLAHGISNVIGAAFSGAPLLVTAGNYGTGFQHEEPILHGDLASMVDQYTKWSAEVTSVDALPAMLRRAVRQALTPPTGPVFLGLPLDVMLADPAADVQRLGPIPDAGRGDPDALAAAADLVAEASAPVVVIGDEVARSGPDAIEGAVAFAEASGARVHGEYITAEANFPSGHPLWGGTVPGTESGFTETLDTDTVVFVGCGSATTSIDHEEPLLPDATIVQLGPDGWELGKNWPADASVLGDLGRVLPELAAAIEDRVPEADRRARGEQARERAAEIRDARRPADPDPDDPRASKGELGAAMGEAASGALIVNEGVTAGRAVSWHVDTGPEEWLATKSGGLGYGLPAAVGAAIAEGERPEPRDVVGFIGDGSYFYYPQSIYSAVRHGVDLTVVVADNRNYRILKDNTLRVLGGSEADHDFVAMDFEPPLDVPANAGSYGADGRLVDDPDGIAAAIDDARRADGVAVLDVPIHD